MNKQNPQRMTEAMKAYDRKFKAEERNRQFFILLMVFVVISLTLIMLINIWRRRPQPRFLFLTEEWLADEVEVDSLIVRDETVYEAPVDGIFRPLVAQGSKVAKNTRVGQIVPVSDLEELRKLDKANNDVDDRRYELLSAGKGGNAGRVFEVSEDAIKRNLNVLYDTIIENENYKIYEIETEIRLILEQRIEDARFFDFEDEELDRLISLRDTLAESSFERIRDVYSESSGIFIAHIDGFEVDLNRETAMSMTVPELKNFLASVGEVNPKESFEAGDNLYKLNRSNDHYFVCNIPMDQLSAVSDLQTNAAVRLYVESKGLEIKNAEVIRKDVTNDGTLLVLRSNQNLESFVAMRKVPLTLYLNEAKGLRVPKTALIDYETGNLEADVKIVDGGYIHQVTVKILEHNAEYALIAELEDSAYPIVESTMVLLNPESMKEGDSIAKSYN